MSAEPRYNIILYRFMTVFVTTNLPRPIHIFPCARTPSAPMPSGLNLKRWVSPIPPLPWKPVYDTPDTVIFLIRTYSDPILPLC